MSYEMDFVWVYFGDIFSSDSVAARVTPLCQMVCATIIVLIHDVVAEPPGQSWG